MPTSEVLGIYERTRHTVDTRPNVYAIVTIHHQTALSHLIHLQNVFYAPEIMLKITKNSRRYRELKR